MKQICLLIIMCCWIFTAKAQQTTVYTEKEYSRNPLWISMIKDTTVNFFEAEKAFKVYFKHHDKPEGENEDIGEHEKREKYPSKREQREMQRESHMRMEVKRYEHWRDMVRPYVQPDGRILTPSQRIQIWEQQKSRK